MNRLISVIILLSEFSLFIWYLWDIPRRRTNRCLTILSYLLLFCLWYILRSIVFDASFVLVFLLILSAIFFIYQSSIKQAFYLASVFISYIYAAGIITIYPVFLLRHAMLPIQMDYLHTPTLLLCEIISLLIKALSLGLFRRLVPSILKVQLNWLQIISATIPVIIALVMNSISSVLMQAQGTEYQFILLRLIFLLCFIIYVSSAASTLAIRYQYRDLENLRIQQRMKEQYTMFEEYTNRVDVTRKVNHDMKNHLLVIAQMPQIQQIRSYITSILGQLDSLGHIEYTHNLIIDSLINSKMTYLNEHHITLKIIADFRELCGIDDVDLCAIFGNALDNAIEAVKDVIDPEKRIISIKAYRQSSMWLLQFGNYFCGDLLSQDGMLQSTHGSSRGLGMKSIQYAVKKYHGEMSYEIIQDYFTLKIIWPEI